jgi:Cu/Zn superoxide dismutase
MLSIGGDFPLSRYHFKQLAIAILAPCVFLAACASSDDEGGFPSRPELIMPPGEMATQRLVLLKLVDEKGKGDTVGSLALSDVREGLKIVVDFKKAPGGPLKLTLNEGFSCDVSETEGVKVPAADAGAPYQPEERAVRYPTLEPDAAGVLRTEIVVLGLRLKDSRERSFVLTNSAGARVACGISQ